MIFAFLTTVRTYPVITPLFIALAAACFLCTASVSHGAEFYWGNHPDKERLVIAFDQAAPSHTLLLTGDTEVTLALPPAIWQHEARPGKDDFRTAKYLAGVEITDNSLKIRFKTNNIHFTHSVWVAKNKIIIDVFPGYQAPAMVRYVAENPPAYERVAVASQQITPVQEPEAARPVQQVAVQQAPSLQTPSPRAENRTDEPEVGEIDQEPVDAGMPEVAADIVMPDASMLASAQPGDLPPRAPAQDAPNSQQTAQEVERALSSIAALAPMPDAGAIALQDAPSPEQHVRQLDLPVAQTSAAMPIHDDYMDWRQELDPIREAMRAGDSAQAIIWIERLKKEQHVDPQLREQAMYLEADAMYDSTRDELATRAVETGNAYIRAIAVNPSSQGLPHALFQLAHIHMAAGSMAEARGYLAKLANEYPSSPQAQGVEYLMAHYELGRGRSDEAINLLSEFLRNHPQHVLAMDAAMDVARLMNEKGDEQGFAAAVDYTRSRWPNLQADNPDFLLMLGDAAMGTDQVDQASDFYRAYAASSPGLEESSQYLVRMGRVHQAAGQGDKAENAYLHLIAIHPGSDEALMARMDLAAMGRLESATHGLQGLDARLDGAAAVYGWITTNHSQSSQAPVAMHALAMYQLEHGEYEACIDSLGRFLGSWPSHGLVPGMKALGHQAFSALVEQAVTGEDFNRVMAIWSHNEQALGEEGLLPKSRIALAVAAMQEGADDFALELADGFLDGSSADEYSELALHMILEAYIKAENWDGILRTASRVAGWTLNEERQAGLAFAIALAKEHGNEIEAATPLWEAVKDSPHLSSYRRALAFYYLALREAHAGNILLAAQKAEGGLSLLETNGPEGGLARTFYALLTDLFDKDNNPEMAVEWAMASLRIIPLDDPERPVVLYKAAQLHRKRGDLTAYTAYLQEIVNFFPETVYGKMAASELGTPSLEREVEDLLASQRS